MGKQVFDEPYAPRYMSLDKQEAYYGALMRFWVSVENKYPRPYNRQKVTLFTRDYKRVQEERKKE